MFDGVAQDQLHHLIASSRTNSYNNPSSSPPLSSFPHHHHHSQITTNNINTNTNIISNNNSNSFDSFPHQLLFPLHQHHEFLHHHHHHHPILHHKSSNFVNGSLGCQAGNKVQAVAAEIGGDRDLMADTWTDEEVLQLLRIRSSMENWFPDFTWEHVSRKLAELGFQIRSAEKCKEKFEEESRYLNSNNNCTKNNLLFRPFLTGELEELYNNNNNNHQTQPNTPDHHHHTIVEPQKTEKDEIRVSVAAKKRKRRTCSGEDDKFEALKGFCEEVVNKLMARQEEMHGKLIDDMVRRDREKAEKEEAWKRTEFERLDRELDHMARDQALAVDRHSSVVELLTKLASVNNNSVLAIRESPSDDPAPNDRAVGVVRRNPNPNPDGSSLDLGKRWPRDEVLALINLRCDGNNRQEKESLTGGSSKAVPLWERISQGMSEMGYKRSAKRCKEKWENINKYFRKTKDVNKKRSVDSRTCPYFDHLSTLYNKGTLVNHHNNHDDEDCDHLINHSSDYDHRDVHVVGDHRGERSETTTIANNTNNNGNGNNNSSSSSVVVVPSAFDFEF